MNTDTFLEQQAVRPLLLVIIRDYTNGHYQLTRTVTDGDGSFAPVASYLDAGAAVRDGLREAERSGTRFLGVAR